MFFLSSEELTNEQQDAIKEESSVLLVACPGSGKTRTLTYKIAYELSRLKNQKTFVVAITYTNTAADEIKDRVETLGVDTSNLWIGTIHSFCLDWLLRPYALYVDELKHGFSIIDAHEAQELLNSICQKHDNKLKSWDCDYLIVDGKIQLSNTDLSKHEILKKILSEYLQTLESRKQIDFEHILYFSLHLLNEKPEISKVLCNMFHYLLVDEFQDTKNSQYQIVGNILQSNKGKTRLFIVGDPNQAIFHSLGGYSISKDDLENLLGFSVKEMSLTKNYRSSEKIISYFSYFRTNNLPIAAEGRNKRYESIVSYNNSVSKSGLEDEIIRLVRYNLEEKKIKPNEICILGPQWVHLASLTRSLVTKLPDISFNGPGLTPFSHDIENFWYKISRIVLTEPSPTMYSKRIRWAKEIIELFSAAGVSRAELTPKKFLELCNSIFISEESGLDFLKKFFDEILFKLKVDIKLFPSLEEHQKAFFESSKSRIERLKKEGAEFVDETKCFKRVFKPREGIIVSSIHGAKGMEFDTVIAFALLDGYVPHFNDTNGEPNSKKMLYVVCSRAKKNLHLISETHRNVHAYHAPSGKPPTPNLSKYRYSYDSI